MKVEDHFSKMTDSFMLLLKLSSTNETAGVILQHMFSLHGLLVDVVSDWGSKFTSVFWRELCKLLGAKVSLSFKFLPQTNSQTKRKNRR